jgi:cytochrome c peroxidase
LAVVSAKNSFATAPKRRKCRTDRGRLVPGIAALALFLGGCGGGGGDAQPSIDTQLREQLKSSSITPPSPAPAQDAAAVALGRALFFDKILSGNRDVSCASCHSPAAALGDGLSLSIGTGGTGAAPARTLGTGRQFFPRNAQTLLNVGLGLEMLFWDARVLQEGSGVATPAGAALPSEVTDPLAAQAMFPVVGRREMRGNPGDVDRLGNANELAVFDDSQFTEIWQAIMQRLLAIPQYAAMLAAAFPNVPNGALGFQHAAAAIAAFERQEFSRTGSPFDRYLAGDNAALTAAEKRGALLFVGDAKCSGCHNGPHLGGNNFANIGVPQLGPGFGSAVPLDSGLARFLFRVAPLRNVELTAPYMHDGAYTTLESAVRHYIDIPFSQQNYDVSQLAPELQSTHHGDPGTTSAVLASLDTRLPPPGTISESQVSDLVAFLMSLTDPAARDLSSLVPASVPSGLPVGD